LSQPERIAARRLDQDHRTFSASSRNVLGDTGVAGSRDAGSYPAVTASLESVDGETSIEPHQPPDTEASSSRRGVSLTSIFVRGSDGWPSWRLPCLRDFDVDQSPHRGMRAWCDPSIRNVECHAWRQSSLFDQREKIVLDYAEAMTRSDQRADDDMVQRLRSHFTDLQVAAIRTLDALIVCPVACDALHRR
jgi:hypothetical protein